MKKSLYLLFISLFLVTSSIYAQCDWWVKSYGGIYSENVKGMEVDDAGNVYITGTFSGTADFGDISVTSYGDKDIFVAKINKDGVPVWVKNAGGTYEDEVNNIAIDNNGNVYIAGNFQNTVTFGTKSITSNDRGNVFIAKYTDSGAVSWVINGGYQDPSGYERRSEINPINFLGSHLYVTGYGGNYMLSGSDTIAEHSNEYYTGFFAKINTDGTFTSLESFDVYVTSFYKIDIDGEGNIYTTGSFRESINLTGDELVSTGGSDVFLAKYNENLECLWVKKMGGSNDESSHSIYIDDNSVYLTGAFRGTATFENTNITASGGDDVFISKYDANGNLNWVKSIGESDGYDGSYVTGSTTGEIYVSFEGSNPVFDNKTVDGYGTFIAKYTNSGDFIEAARINSDNAWNSENTISINSENQILFSFGFRGDYNSIGSVYMESKGDDDIAILKLNNLLDLKTFDPEICIVTLDDDQQKNKLIIEDPQSSDVLGFNVYKGNVFGEFDSIGFVDYSSGNTSFIDEFSSPVKKYSVYAVSLLDKCGKESGLSDAHKTTHLVIYPGPNKKWSLIWDYYGIDGEYDYKYYRIYRGTDINNLELIDSVSTQYSEMTFSYTDINAPSGSLYYQVEAAIDANCSNSLAKSNKAFYIENASSIDDDFTEDGLTIFPNPTEGVFNLSSKTLLTSPVSVEIFNVKGDLINNTVIEDYNVSGKQFDLTGVSKGVYFMKVQSKQSVSVKKFCIK